MDITIITVAAFCASLLTFFSGFGLGTILLPVFALFFPVDVSVALTGIVHLINNVFKIVLTGRHGNKNIILRFGIPAIFAAFIGAWLLITLDNIPPLHQYKLGDQVHHITILKLVIAVLLAGFALFEILPRFKGIHFSTRWLSLGGALSGFFGGLSGLQGALRSAFLVKAGLTKESYIATAAILASIVDITRLSVYVSGFMITGLSERPVLVISAVIAALAGSLAGKKMIRKVSFTQIQNLVAIMLILIAIAMAAGLI